MSFFTKLFGSETKKEQPKKVEKPKANDSQAKKIEIEAAVNDLESKIKIFEDNEKKYQHKVQVLKAKAKQLIDADKKKDAKKYIEEATRVKKQAQSYSLRKKTLVDKKSQLEQTIMDMETINAMQGAQKHMKDQEKYSEKLQGIILDGQEAKMQQQQINDRIKGMVGEQEDEDVDDLMKELEMQVKKDKMEKIQVKNNVAVDSNVSKQTAVSKQDDLDAMLNAI